MTGTDLIDAIHAHRSNVATACQIVDSVAARLWSLGMERAAEELWDAIAGLNDGAKEVSAQHSLELNAKLRNAEEMSGLLLAATLKGAIR